MISFPNAKINLGLSVISKRPDGFHNITSCFYPIPWKDILEIIPSKDLKFTHSGIDIPGNPNENLCLKAYRLLKQDFDLPLVHIHLHKIIPIGAGLGGGSADGAFVLKMLNEKSELGLSNHELKNYAAQLGSDCPFFIENTPVLATGTGTDFSAIPIDLKGKFLIIIKPNIHISTAEAYSGVVPKQAIHPVKEIIKNHSIESWKDLLHNDFEDSIFPNHPEIEEIKTMLYNKGAIYASMTGSGAAVYGIFNEPFNMATKKGTIAFAITL